MVGDVSNLLELMPDEYRDGSVAADWAFCRWLAAEHGVVAIPSSPFFTDEPSRPLVRFAFCKSDEILGVAAARLKALADRCRVSDV